MGRLFLVRHGQSAWNAAGRVQGQASGNPLTSTGLIEASQAAMRLRGCGARRIVSSDLQRAAQTARILAGTLDLAVEWEPALREQAAGSLEGRLARELVAQEVPDGVHINEVRWGGGESVADVHERLARWWVSRKDALDGPVIVVSHGIALQVLRAVLAGQGPREVEWADALGNGEVVAVDAS